VAARLTRAARIVGARQARAAFGGGALSARRGSTSRAAWAPPVRQTPQVRAEAPPVQRQLRAPQVQTPQVQT